ncbi:MAG: preprotein translocase subunit SecE [Candidatus Delongbacteria bacterium]|nr:preprotein translocase subunit SecE [Candidatus Delongbacteria bacterium]MDD4204741.1 preprotein translocase subunit SecE [Candidatus Delongbacteria bacterium]
MKKMIDFINSVIKELKIMTWPSKAEVWGSTKIVIAISLILVAFIFFSDQVLNWLIKQFIN